MATPSWGIYAPNLIQSGGHPHLHHQQQQTNTQQQSEFPRQQENRPMTAGQQAGEGQTRSATQAGSQPLPLHSKPGAMLGSLCGDDSVRWAIVMAGLAVDAEA